MFDALSDRLSGIFESIRGKGRLTDADIDATAREIRLALLEADVALPVVKTFINEIKERCKGAEVSKALNPAQQIVKIVNEELIAILGGETRRLNYAKQAPTVIMLAGLQGAGKTTLAGKLAKWLKGDDHSPLLVAADLQRPNAVGQLQVLAERAGVAVYAPEPGSGVGDPVKVEVIGVSKRNLRDVALPKVDILTHAPPIILVCGSCMSVGKTATLEEIIKGLTRQGLKVGGAKITGIAALKDILRMRVAGAVRTYSLLDCGVPSTVDTDDVAGIARSIVAKMADLDVVVMELGDGIVGHYNVEGFFEDGEAWGNFPQAYSHVGLIMAAMRLSRPWTDAL